MIERLDDVLSEAICQRLIALHARQGDNVYRSQGSAIFCHVVADCERRATRLFPKESLVCETALLARLGVGGRHVKHADNCRLDGKPNHTPNRVVTAIYYLNSDCEGGEIAFENFNLTIKPQRGLLLMFPSDLEHRHEVLPVKAGTRYTAAIWFKRAFAPFFTQ